MSDESVKKNVRNGAAALKVTVEWKDEINIARHLPHKTIVSYFNAAQCRHFLA
ncbi:hypothetical protein [Polluticoccus soli]|uniref:hypothetical protein n=1 Tax=Polluticoccus soli TaxID=3034150 RepID=UPI0023E24CD0|nr:hypothetical protein [Flavipsychrobacter sp. JY13-12]